MTVSDFLAVFFRLYVRSVMFVGLSCHDFFFFISRASSGHH